MNSAEWSSLRHRLQSRPSSSLVYFFERLAEDAEVGIGACPETGALPGETEEDLRLRTRDFGTELR